MSAPRYVADQLMHRLGRYPVRVLPLVAMLMPNWMDPEYLLHWMGNWALWGTLLVVFIECGVLFPILPGDSLLFAVGLFIAQGTIDVPLWLACVLLTIAAFLGNVSGYYIGRALGYVVVPQSERPVPETEVHRANA